MSFFIYTTFVKKSEEMGFEPMIQKKMYADLANQCLRPLSHSSFFKATKDLFNRKFSIYCFIKKTKETNIKNQKQLFPNLVNLEKNLEANTKMVLENP